MTNHSHSHGSDSHGHEHTHEESSEHSHGSQLSHAELEAALASTFAKSYKARLTSRLDLNEEAYEESWSIYAAAKKEVTFQTMAVLAQTVLKYAPNTKFIVLYEDHSHDAPHGHIESLLDNDGHQIQFDVDWHDLSWSSEVDEYVWDIYNLAKEHFVNSSNKRRFIIEV